MGFFMFGPSKQEIDDLVNDLTVRYGDDAYDSALRLCDAWRSLGAKKHEKLCRLAARELEAIFEGRPSDQTAAAQSNQ